jgi:hypothetical protein
MDNGYAVRQMLEFRSDQWGIYFNNELVEGGFFDRREAEEVAWAEYGMPIVREGEEA